MCLPASLAKNRGAFQIVLVADAAERRAGGELFDPDSFDRALRHPRRKEAGRQSIGRNSVASPTTRRARVKLTTAPLLVL